MHHFYSKGIWAGAALAVATLVGEVRAELVQYQFKGSVSAAFDTTGLWAAVPVVGDLMTTTFSHSGTEQVFTYVYPENISINVNPPHPNYATTSAGSLSFATQFWVVNISDANPITWNDRITFYTYNPFWSDDYATYLSVEWIGPSNQFDGYDVAGDWKNLLTPATASNFLMTYLLAPVIHNPDGSRSFNLDSPAARVQGRVTAIEMLPTGTPVPESSTYSLAAAVALMALAGWRSLRPR